MTSTLRRLAVAAVLPTLMIAGCSASEDPDSPAPDTSVSSTVESMDEETPAGSPSASAPFEDETSVEETSSEGSPAQTPTEEGSSAANDPEEAAVPTNALLGVGEQFGDMTQTSAESDPATDTAVIEYESSDTQAGMRLYMFIPNRDGQSAPLTGTDDELFTTIVEESAALFDGDTGEVSQRVTNAGGMEWHCTEALRSEGTDNDHVMCVSVAHTRLIEMQYIAPHDEDPTAMQQTVDAYLGEISEALAALG